MVISLLEQFVLAELFTFLILFTRIGAFIMAMPAIGDTYVPTNVRLILALSISLMLVPMLSSSMPDMPQSALRLGIMLMAEIFIGAFFGIIARFLMTTMNVAGTIIANQSTLAIASIFEATAGIQTAIVSNFLTLAVLAMFFALDLHHILLSAIIQSYQVFPTGSWINMGDAGNLLARTLSDIFILAVQFSAPSIVLGLLLYISAGIMARMMPTFQVFFVLLPPQIVLALILLMFTLPPILNIYSNYLEEKFLALTVVPLEADHGR